MQNQPLKIFILGTATFDHVRGHPGLTELNDEKEVRKFKYTQVGGGGVNARLALQALADAYKQNVTPVLCTKLGQKNGEENPAKKKVLDALGITGMGDKTLMDIAFDQPDFLVQENLIFLFGGGDEVKRFISKEYDDINTPFSPTIDQEIMEGVQDCNIILLNSRFPTQGAVAGLATEAPVILDYSESNGDKPGVEALVDDADYILVPLESILPDMKRTPSKVKEEPDTIVFLNKDGTKKLSIKADDPNRARLMIQHLKDNFGKKYIALSNGSEPVQVHANGKDFTIELNNIPYFAEYDETGQAKPKWMDNLGAGDARDAALSFFMARGEDFETAIIKASRFASFTAQYPGRTWIKHLDEFLRADPAFKNDFPSERNATSEFERSSAHEHDLMLV